MNCQNCKAAMPELLLHPAAAPAASAHLETCSICRKEFASLQATLTLLDTWKAPEPSAYFDQKLAVLLREEQAKPPASWLERLQSHLLFNTGRQFRPALAGTIALALLVGGGTFASISRLPTDQRAIQVSAAVGDLQILDKNAQALQQMDQLLQEAQPADDATAPPPIS
jgi:hypothetical protein